MASTEEIDRFGAAAQQHHLWLKLGRDPMIWTIGKAMKECGFSDSDSKNATLQQRVRRLEKKIGCTVETSSSNTISVASEDHQSPPVPVVEMPILPSPMSAISEVSFLSSGNRSREAFMGNCKRTSRQKHAARKEQFKQTTAAQELHKLCTKEIAEEKDRQNQSRDHGRKKGTKVLLREFAVRHNVSVEQLPAARTIEQAIKDGRAGLTPPKRGRKGNIPETDFQQLGLAVKTYVALSASNGDEKSYADIKKTVNTIANSKTDKSFPDRYDYTLIERLFTSFGIDLNAAKQNPAEARRVLWTTRANLTTMFDSWKELLLVLEFAEEKTEDNCANAVELTLENILDGHTLFLTGELLFELSQLRRIVNVDETCLSLDGLSGNKGGRPSLSFHDPTLPRAGKAVSKCGFSATLVIGGNAAGEAAPPHFQFPSTAQESNQQMRFTTIEDARDVQAQFGHNEAVRLSPTYGMNEKGGMDEMHFERYLIQLVERLFPDVADAKGKCVIIKADQGPGRSNLRLLAHLRARGIYLFPSVPNTSSVTQEMDQIFDLFKRLTRLNVEKYHESLLVIGKSVSLGRDDCCRIVFGGTFQLEDGSSVELEEAFERSFSQRRMLQGFAKVGAAPLTRNCLLNEKVRIEISEEPSEEECSTEQRIRQLDEQLQACVSYLLLAGYEKAGLLSVRAKKRAPTSNRITLPHTEERQLQFLKAKTTGGKYHALNGTHITHDDLFIALEKQQRSEQVKALEVEKNNRIAAKGREKEAFTLMDRKERDGFVLANLARDQKKWLNPEIDILLKWKLGKKPPDVGTKVAKVAEWQRVKDLPAPIYSEWTEDDEARLVALKGKVSIDDTELGRERQRLKQQTAASVALMTDDELALFEEKIKAARRSRNDDSNSNSNPSAGNENNDDNNNDLHSNSDDAPSRDDNGSLGDDDSSLEKDVSSARDIKSVEANSGQALDLSTSSDSTKEEAPPIIRSRRARAPKPRTRYG